MRTLFTLALAAATLLGASAQPVALKAPSQHDVPQLATPTTGSMPAPVQLKERHRAIMERQAQRTPQTLAHRADMRLGRNIAKAANPFRAPQAEYGRITDLGGGVPYSGAWTSDNGAWGLYAFDSRGDGTLTPLKVDSRFTANNGGAAYDGKYYVIERYTETRVGTWCRYYVLDMDTWEILHSYEPAMNIDNYTFDDLAVDPTDGTVYGSWWSYHGGSEASLVKIDFYDFKVTEVGVIPNPGLSTMAFDSEGTLWVIDEDGDLEKMDKTTGTLEMVKDLPLEPWYSGSAVIDDVTGTMYVTVNDVMDGGYLYAIDLRNGYACEKVITFPYNEQVQGLFMNTEKTPEGAPKPAEQLKATFVGNALTGTLDFKVPADAGTVNYSITVNGQAVRSGQATGGQSVSAPVEAPQAGYNEFGVRLSNSAGASPHERLRIWVGEDIPVPTGKVENSYASGTFTVTWEPVTETEHNGYMNTEAVSYKITRTDCVNNRSETVAEGVTGTTHTYAFPEPSTYSRFTHSVEPVYAGATGTATTSGFVHLGSYMLPYEQAFNNPSSFDEFIVIDAGGNGTWEFQEDWTNGGYRLVANDESYPYEDEGKNDWLMFPAMQFETGKKYKLTFTTTRWAVSEDQFKCYYGTEPTIEAMKTLLFEHKTETVDGMSVDNYPYSYEFEVAKSGVYHLGFHADTPPGNGYEMFVDDIEISAGIDAAAPAAVSNFSAVAASLSGDEATITFTTPTTTYSGTALSSLTRVEVWRDGVVVYAENNPQKGKQYQYVDRQVPMGYHTYTAIAYNSAGSGAIVRETIWVGINVPDYPKNIVAVPGDTYGSATVTWDHVTNDYEGNPLNPALVTYEVSAIDYEYNRNLLVAVGITDNKVENQRYYDATMQQTMAETGVRARTAAGYGLFNYSNMLPFGKPFALPWHEHFSGTPFDYGNEYLGEGYFYAVTDNDYPGLLSADGDAGMLAFHSEAVGDTGYIESMRVDLTEAVQPVLSFKVAPLIAGDVNVWEVFANADDGNGWVSLGKVNVGSNPVNVWQNRIFPLTQYVGKAVRLRLQATIRSVTVCVIDDLAVRDLADTDVVAGLLQVPLHAYAGNEVSIKAHATGRGVQPVASYTAELLLNGAVVDSKQGRNLALDARHDIDFRYTMTAADEDAQFQVRINLEGDANPDDNLSEPFTIALRHINLGLAGTLDGDYADNSVDLRWTGINVNEPGVLPEIENFELMPIFGDMSPWTTLDLDGELCTQEVLVSHYDKPVSWLPFTDLEIQGTPVSGHQYAGSVVNGYYNDDWLITPELSGRKQTISFYARSYSMLMPESFELLYSTDGIDPADFVTIAEYPFISTDWTEYSAELPKGARYFAIRNISAMCLLLMVDDVAYEGKNTPTLTFLGYNIYRDGVKLNTEPVQEKTWHDTYEAGTQPEYRVTAIYNGGESAPSNAYIPGVTAIDSIDAADAEARYYDMLGRPATNPGAGLWLEVRGNKARKVIIK